MPKLIRITTVPLSLKLLLSGQMKFMKDSGWDVLMVSADGREINNVVKRENSPHHIIPFTRQITPFWDLYCLWLLFRLFRKEKPDVVHTHTPKAGLLGMIAAKFAGVKVRIHTVAGLPYMAAEKNKKNLLIKAEKWTYKYATHIWPNSQSLKDFILSEKLIDESKVEVLGSGSSNGVDLDIYNRSSLKENHLVAATMRVMPGENEFIVLAVGRLVKDKGIEELVKAFLDSKIVNRAKLVLLGSFEQELNPIDDQILRQIEDHPKIVQVEWTDHVSHYMAISDILVHPSHREGFPNVLLEAGAMQLPIICSNIIGNKDVVTDRKTGLMFPVKKVDVLKDALEFAYVKREYMQQLAENLHQEIISKYDRKVMHALILENYNKLLSEN
ncbi:glycosyltransferase family 4 protein [Belliella aquatica]|uniref:Capsular polysaccharide biosynthesis protein n=1 Tax=Belliella aquatica TaxID=1323734 RepID=A0ABQ1M908_9BACT|nr:glycosyltransferase family 4 protein [Belliella aquatica]MCH7404663.1 glycosyltransferase family 4 protein [Belliella aquatica]GGC35098.1 capsular polysaccharide biosynthesis protein [Belliella aquatica]